VDGCKLEFDVTRDDFLAFNRVGMRRLFMPRRPIRLAVVTLVAVGLFVGFSVLEGGLGWVSDRPFGWVVGILIIAALAVVVLFFTLLLVSLIYAKHMIRTAPDDRLGIGRQRLEASVDGIHDHSPKGEELHRWRNVREIVDGQAHVFIFVGRVKAYLLPKRAIAPAELETFLAICRARLAKD